MKNKNVYCYLVAQDTGFAPCYDNSLFTLACCKPTIRKSIYKRFKDNNNLLNEGVYVIGVKHEDAPDEKDEYKSRIVYIAKITQVLTFEEYFDDNNYESRADCIYKDIKTEEVIELLNNKNSNLEEIKKEKNRMNKKETNPHYCNTDLFRRDISGLCVLKSDEFYYVFDKYDSSFCELTDIYEHCKKRRPGVFFYPDVNTKKLEELLVSLKKKGLKNRKDIKPSDKPENKKCVC